MLSKQAALEKFAKRFFISEKEIRRKDSQKFSHVDIELLFDAGYLDMNDPNLGADSAVDHPMQIFKIEYSIVICFSGK